MNFVYMSDYISLSGIDVDILRCKIKHLTTIESVIEAVVSLCVLHPHYGTLAAKLELRELYKCSISNFYQCMMYFKDQLSASFLSNVEYLVTNTPFFEFKYIQYKNDRLFTYPALKTLKSMFLLTNHGIVYERPQHLYMRLAIQLHGRDLPKVIETYNLLSQHWYTHATPSMMNAGKKMAQLSSCFLVSSPTMDTFFTCMERCLSIFKSNGGIGLALHKIPVKYFVPCARILDNVLKLSSGVRDAACAIYLELWHGSITDFLNLKTNVGDSEAKARNVFCALWVSDLFMDRVEKDAMWSLFCPEAAPDLEKVYGKEFKELYEKYEREGKYMKRMKARDLFKQVIVTQIQTGGPYFLYKDTCNKLSPYRGTLQCSNLCAEIIEYASNEEVAVCTLASLSLPKFVRHGAFDFDKLAQVTKIVVKNLDCVISVGNLPVDACANEAARPIGCGIQGLNDVFQMLRLEFESPEAKSLNKKIAKTIYEAANEASWEMSTKPTQRRNILLVAYMPTAICSLIMDNTEGMEPITSNMYIRRLKIGNFYTINKHLIADLIRCGMWNDETREQLIRDYGSVKNLKNFPHKDLYKTVWEIPQKTLVDFAIDRKEFVDQSQSLNIFIETPTISQISALHFYTWKHQLKTGLYYLRTQAAYQPIQFSLSCCTA